MKRLGNFQYFEPKTIAEAISLLNQYQEKAKILAGGTDLLVGMKHGEASPEYLINIKSISGLDQISYEPEKDLKIGALTTVEALESSPLIRDKFRIIAQAAHALGSAQVRNRATLGGNLCNASPSADLAPPLLALRAKVKVLGPRGDKSFPLEEFFQGPGKTLLPYDEILKEIEVPLPSPYSQGVYLKLGPRKAMDIAVVGVAVLITLASLGGICQEARIVLGAVAPTPLRAKKAEEILRGKKMEEDVIERAAQVASEEASPISDIRSSAEYRKDMVKVLVKRAITQALELFKI